MADLKVTIEETATGLQGDQSISDTIELTMSGIVSFYHFKGQASSNTGYSHSIYDEETIPTGMGGSKNDLAYLRITNLEASTDEMPLIINTSVGGLLYLNLATNESFIFCNDSGSIYQMAERTDGDTTINSSGYIESIYFENGGDFAGKHYEIYAAFIDD